MFVHKFIHYYSVGSREDHSKDIPFPSPQITGHYLRRFGPYLVIFISVEHFHAFNDLAFIFGWRAVTQVVHHLIPNFGVFIVRTFEESLPEFGNVVQHTAWAHLLESFQPYLVVRNL